MESPSTPRQEKKGIGRLWTKVKLALRLKSKSKSKSNTSPNIATSDTSNTPIPQRPTAPNQDLAGQPSISKPLDTQVPTQPPTEMEQPSAPTIQTAGVAGELPSHHDTTQPTPSKPGHEPMPESSPPKDQKDEHNRRYERAQAMFKKYNLDINEADWESRPAVQAERVYKAPRMRVRWTCHECKTTFGHDKVCVECAHHRCRECARYPPKKRKARAVRRAAAAAATPSDDPQEDVQEGTCHECQTSFDLGSTECSNCHHQICERCLQETVASAEQVEAPTVSTH